MGKPRLRERAGGLELVVRREQGQRAVEHADARPLETAQMPQAVLDAIERRSDVETGQRLVARHQAGKGLARRQEGRLDSKRPTGPDERLIRGRGTVGDQGKARRSHAEAPKCLHAA
jgi:hypothetical protein